MGEPGITHHGEPTGGNFDEVRVWKLRECILRVLYGLGISTESPVDEVYFEFSVTSVSSSGF